MKNTTLGLLLILVASTFGGLSGCSTAPKSGDQAAFRTEANGAREWFEWNVTGLRKQIKESAGYIVFPSVGQWGIVFGGGQFGRGLVCYPSGTQMGWGAVNTASLGLQAGVRGYKLLIVFKDRATLEKYMSNQLSGSASGVVVIGEAGGGALAPFESGVAVYQGASTGLMAGVNIGLELLKYQPLETSHAD